jgi:adenylate kinase family enzyme
MDPNKVNVVFIIGGPGSRKGTLCKRLKEDFHYEHLSTGDILRNVVKNKTHPDWKTLDDKMKSGQFVSSTELLGFVKDEFKNFKGKKVLLDGFPRNQENIDVWDKTMNDICNLKGVLYLEASKETMKKRMLGRNEGRADDNEETMVKRIDNFFNETVKVVEPYDKKGLVHHINADKDIKEYYEGLKKDLTAKNF